MSDAAGCGCVGLKEACDRTEDPTSIYYGLRDHSDFDSSTWWEPGKGTWDRDQSCDDAGIF
jgi:hypothetical protein